MNSHRTYILTLICLLQSNLPIIDAVSEFVLANTLLFPASSGFPSSNLPNIFSGGPVSSVGVSLGYASPSQNPGQITITNTSTGGVSITFPLPAQTLGNYTNLPAYGFPPYNPAPTGLAYPAPTGLAYPAPTGLAYPAPTGLAYPAPTGLAYPVYSNPAYYPKGPGPQIPYVIGPAQYLQPPPGSYGGYQPYGTYGSPMRYPQYTANNQTMNTTTAASTVVPKLKTDGNATTLFSGGNTTASIAATTTTAIQAKEGDIVMGGSNATDSDNATATTTVTADSVSLTGSNETDGSTGISANETKTTMTTISTNATTTATTVTTSATTVTTTEAATTTVTEADTSTSTTTAGSTAAKKQAKRSVRKTTTTTVQPETGEEIEDGDTATDEEVDQQEEEPTTTTTIRRRRRKHSNKRKRFRQQQRRRPASLTVNTSVKLESEGGGFFSMASQPDADTDRESDEVFGDRDFETVESVQPSDFVLVTKRRKVSHSRPWTFRKKIHLTTTEPSDMNDSDQPTTDEPDNETTRREKEKSVALQKKVLLTTPAEPTSSAITDNNLSTTDEHDDETVSRPKDQLGILGRKNKSRADPTTTTTAIEPTTDGNANELTSTRTTRRPRSSLTTSTPSSTPSLPASTTELPQQKFAEPQAATIGKIQTALKMDGFFLENALQVSSTSSASISSTSTTLTSTSSTSTASSLKDAIQSSNNVVIEQSPTPTRPPLNPALFGPSSTESSGPQPTFAHRHVRPQDWGIPARSLHWL